MSPIAFASKVETVAEVGFHDAAAIFELLDGAEFDELVADIKVQGLKLPIVLHEGKILDGRNRYRACRAAGVDPVFRQWDGAGSPSEFVRSLNEFRRHLDGNAKALAAARFASEQQAEGKARQIAALKRGTAKAPLGPNGPDGNPKSSSSIAAEKFGLPERTVKRAVKIVKDGTPELQKAVAEERISISAAAAVADEDPETQRRIANSPEVKKAVRALQEAKALRDEVRAEPPSKPLTPEEHANVAKAFGSKEAQARTGILLKAVESISALPPAGELAAEVPAVFEHTIDVPALLGASAWLDQFARAWEGRIQK